ncbi:hypothetical protein DEO72_LG4g1464 [Vigna unguiculata]|uniref:Uncharacterized protein n=1 Tax=Vigna unguiculata TaxID=3917 RepID=A0A4D6LQ44_VIGUN|nr:hypothetical protein DEO72_LG4g1464 [Vigna unguiculata]
MKEDPANKVRSFVSQWFRSQQSMKLSLRSMARTKAAKRALKSVARAKTAKRA